MSNPVAASPLGLEFRLVANQTTYRLELNAKSPEEFRRRLHDLQQRSEAGDFLTIESFPAPPEVDMQIEFHNRSDHDIELWLGGDDSGLTLELTGPGAVTVNNGGPFTADIKYSSPLRLAAGAKHVIPLHQLFHGARGYGSQSYWTEPGEYTLTAHFQLGAPSGSPEDLYAEPSPGRTLTSEPVQIRVTAS